MNIERFKQQHIEILDGIDALRSLSKGGVAAHAAQIASGIVSLSRVITLHLAVEDRILYPTLENSSSTALANMSRTYRHDMARVANPFIAFARKWRVANTIENDPEGFRNEANIVLRQVYERMSKEDREFYPAIEAAGTV